MKIAKEIVSFAADLSVCFCFALLVLVAWPWIESSEDFKDGGRAP